MMNLRPELGFSGHIRAIMLGFGPSCLDLGHFAWVWVILLGFGLFGRIWVRIGPKGDEALRMGRGGGTDGQIPSVFYRTSPSSGPLPKKQMKGRKVAKALHGQRYPMPLC